MAQLSESTSSVESIPQTTENEYLQMANHAKELLEMKDKIILIHKDRLDDVDTELRKICYLISGMGYLLEYKMKQNEPKKDMTFYEMLDKSLKCIKSTTDHARNMTDIDETDQEVALQFMA